MKIANAWICQISENQIIPVFGDLEIKNRKIFRIIKKDPARKEISSLNSGEILNAEGRVLTIPCVNYHDHIYSSLAKGLRISGDMSNFPNILKNLWWKLDLLLDYEEIQASAQMTALESIKKGVTYIIDHHSSPNSAEDSLKIISGEIEGFGLRGIYCFETTDRNGKELSDEGLKENTRFLKKFTTDNSKSMLGLHASFTLDDDTLKKAAELVKENDWCVHVHLCEDISDIHDSNKKYGSNPIERFSKYNLLNERSILAHGIHLSQHDFDISKSSGASVALNLDSNMNNSVGLHKFNLIPANVPVLIGTDGMHSNIAKSVKQLFLLLRHSGLSFDDSFSFIEKSFFDQVNFIKGFFNDFGQLQINDRADFIIWDYIPPTPINVDNFWGHYIYGILERSVKTVVQNGEVILDEFQLTKVDESEITESIKEKGEILYNKFNGDY